MNFSVCEDCFSSVPWVESALWMEAVKFFLPVVKQ